MNHTKDPGLYHRRYCGTIKVLSYGSDKVRSALRGGMEEGFYGCKNIREASLQEIKFEKSKGAEIERTEQISKDLN